MDDTPEDFKSLFRKKLMERSGEDRVMMGDSMFVAAREIALASLSDTAGAAEQRYRLFLRFYGNDFAPEQKQRIKNILSGNPL